MNNTTANQTNQGSNPASSSCQGTSTPSHDTVTTPPPLGPAFFSVANAEKIAYLEGIVGKQLDLYNWCEEKVSTLATIDSILIAVATVAIGDVTFFNPETFAYARIANTVIIIVLLLPLFLSLGITLWHIRPKMGNASNTGIPNHRSSNGIRHFQSKAAYKDRLSTISAQEICDELTNQIYGMNNNIWTNQLSIKLAVTLDIISLVGFFIIVVVSHSCK